MFSAKKKKIYHTLTLTLAATEDVLHFKLFYTQLELFIFIISPTQHVKNLNVAFSSCFSERSGVQKWSTLL